MTTARGGYLILDLEHKSMTLGSGNITVDGIYERLESSYGKPVLITGLVIGNVEQDEAYAMARVESTDYVLRFAGLVITINDDDEVSIDEQESGGIEHISDVVIADGGMSASYTRGDAEFATIRLLLSYTKVTEEEEIDVDKAFEYLIAINTHSQVHPVAVPLHGEILNETSGEVYTGTVIVPVYVSPDTISINHTNFTTLVYNGDEIETSLDVGFTIKINSIS